MDVIRFGFTVVVFSPQDIPYLQAPQGLSIMQPPSHENWEQTNDMGQGIALGYSSGFVIERSRDRVPIGVAGVLSSPGSIFNADSYLYPFHPSVTAVARKRSWSFCHMGRSQITDKHICNLRMWLRVQ